jgi:hypothetical protein
MSTETAIDPERELSPPKEVARSVTPPYRGRPDREMDVIGWSVFLGLVILSLPFLPALVVVWGVKKLLEVLF